MCSYDPVVQSAEILVVDDIPLNLRLLTGILTQLNGRVHQAQSGEEALKLALEFTPDIILLDICMSGMDGFDVCRQLKANPQTHDIPVIFITALTGLEDKLTAFELGGVDYITKPFHNQEVLARVRSQLLVRQLQKQLQIQNQRLLNEILERQEVETSLQTANQALDRANKKLEFLATHDELTQLPNRRYFNDYLHRIWRQMQREQKPLSLILSDIDYFKNYNDTYGHTAGDVCLTQVAQALAHAIRRPFDLAARFGGEEFVIILPNTNLAGGLYVAERVLDYVQALNLPHCASIISSRVTLSIGVATTTPTRALKSEQLIIAADQALYQAKASGRNQIQGLLLESESCAEAC